MVLAAPIDRPEQVRGPKLFITARHDPNGDGSPRLPEIRRCYEQATEPKELVILEGSAHAQLLFEPRQG